MALISITPDKKLNFSEKEMTEKSQWGFPNHLGIKQVFLHASLAFIGCMQNN
jgi:hypothetical protein